MAGLANIYRIWNGLDEAQSLMEEVHTVVKADTITSTHRYHNITNNPALVYQAQGKLEDARDLFEQSLF